MQMKSFHRSKINYVLIVFIHNGRYIIYLSGFRRTVDDRKMEAIIISLLLHNDIHINTTYFEFGRCMNNNILHGYYNII